jgi:hypothetical protein
MHYQVTVVHRTRIGAAFCVCSRECATAAASAIGRLLGGLRTSSVVVTPCVCPLLDEPENHT